MSRPPVSPSRSLFGLSQLRTGCRSPPQSRNRRALVRASREHPQGAGGVGWTWCHSGYVALVARRGKVVYYEAYGVQNPNTKKAMSRDAIFRIYSMTKPITSVAAMILVEEGKIRLSDPVSMYLPELAKLQVATNAGTVKRTRRGPD